MKITVVHGQMHHGSTHHITSLFLEKFKEQQAEITEFYFPKDSPTFCVGCFNCFLKGEQHCPHAASVQPVAQSIEASDLVIMESPCYVFGMTGQMKTFFDHMAYRWMSHRPHPAMFNKVGLCISTASGLGSGRTTKDLRANLFYWGIPKIFRFNVNVGAANWETVTPEKKAQIEEKVTKMAAKISKKTGKVKPGLKTKAMFFIMRMNQKSNKWNPTDKDHWIANGWLNGEKPW